MANLPPERVTISPEPTPLETAAILAAFGELWPAPPEQGPAEPLPTRWRFSGRWWAEDPGRRTPGRTAWR